MRLLALEWNDREARIAAANVAHGRCVVEHAFTVPLSEGGSEEVGRQIGEALAAQGVKKGEVLVALGRGNIELRRLSLPPAPDDELPDMVRMQAMRDFSELNDEWLLDFLPDDTGVDQPRGVLAAAIGPELVDQLNRTCANAGLKMEHLVLRACGAASLLNRVQPERRSELRLTVDLLADEADITLLLEGRVTFLRTVRLPGDPLHGGEAAQVLLGEIRRTMIAAQNQMDGRPVESLALFGWGEAQAELAATLQTTLGKPTELFNPFDAVDVGSALRGELPDRPGCFAPLLGMLLDQSTRTPHTLDFLHPRRRPEPPSRTRQYVMAAGAAILVVAAYLVWNVVEARSLDSDIAELKRQSQALEPQVVRADKATQAETEIAKWAATDTVWLEELADLCHDLPQAQDLMLTQLVFSASQLHGVDVKLDGLARSPNVVDAMEYCLRDREHRVGGGTRSVDPAQKVYSWKFSSSMQMGEEKKP
jgi:Tfp pilus assembly PilM family ATPase